MRVRAVDIVLISGLLAMIHPILTRAGVPPVDQAREQIEVSGLSEIDEVFREFTFSYGASPNEHFAELDPKATFKFTGEHAWGATMPRHVPRPLLLDLTQAVRAELSVEYWGGHIGTSGQQFQVNSNGWIDLPQPVATPAAPQRFYRTLLGNNAVPIPLDRLASIRWKSRCRS
jgi:hypothetical protein